MTIGGETYPVPRPVPRARDAEPDRVRGHLPAARGAGRPLPVQAPRRLPDRRARRPRSSAARSAPAGRCASGCRSPSSSATARSRGACSSTATSSATPCARRRHAPSRRATASTTSSSYRVRRQPARADRPVQAAQALALLRGRGHVLAEDVRDLAPDVLRHRLVLSYDALADGVSADDVLDRVLAAVGAPARRRTAAGGCAAGRVAASLAARPARQGPGPMPARARRGARPRARAPRGGRAARRAPRRRASARAPSSPSCGPYQVGDDVRQLDAAATARTGEPARARARARARADDVARARRLGVDGVRHRRPAEVRRRRGRRARGRPARRAPRRRVALLTCGAPAPRLLPPRGGRARAGRAAARARRGRRRRRRHAARRRAAGACAAIGAARPPPRASWSSSPTSARATRPDPGRARSARWPRATPCSPSRSATRARASCPTPASSCSSTPRRAARRGRHVRRRAAPALRRRRARAPRRAWRATLRRARARHVVAVDRRRLAARPRAGACDELRGARCSCSACCSSRSRSPRWRSPAGAGALRRALPGAADARRGAAARPPRWRRHRAAGAAAASRSPALALALARPQATVAVPVERASVVLVTDASRSMQATDVAPVAPRRRPGRGRAVPRQRARRAAGRPRRPSRTRPHTVAAPDRATATRCAPRSTR